MTDLYNHCVLILLACECLYCAYLHHYWSIGALPMFSSQVCVYAICPRECIKTYCPKGNISQYTPKGAGSVLVNMVPNPTARIPDSYPSLRGTESVHATKPSHGDTESGIIDTLVSKQPGTNNFFLQKNI